MNNTELLKWLIDVSITIDNNRKEAKLMLEYAIKKLKKQCAIADVVKSFTAEEVVRELEDCETLDDAIMYFKEKA